MPAGDRLCRIDEITDGGALEARIDQDGRPRFLVLIRRGASVFAYENVCPHAGRPLNWAPDRFLFSPEGHLVCTVHGATFEVTTGECLLGPCLGASLRAVGVTLIDGMVHLA